MSRLTRNILYNAAGSGLLLLLSFLVVKFVFIRLGPDALGLIYLNITLTAVISTGLELGISATTVREVSAHWETEPQYVAAYIRTASSIYWAMAALAAGVVYLGAPWLVEHWLNLQQLDPGTAMVGVRVLAITAVLALPKLMYASLFRGRQLMGVNNAIDVGMSAVQQVGTIAIVAGRGTLVEVAWYIAWCSVLTQLIYIGFAIRIFGPGSLVPGFSRAVIRRNASFGGHMLSTSVLTIIHTQVDKVVIAKALPLADLGYYGVASNIGARAMILATAVGQAALPALTTLAKARNRAGLIAQYRKLQDLVCFAAVPLFAGIIFASPRLFDFMLNRDASAKLVLPMTLLAVGFYMNATLTLPFVLSVATGQPSIGSRTNFWALLVSAPATILLVLWFGLVGAGLAWVVYHLVLYAYMVPRVSRECLQLPTRDWFEHLARPALAAFALYLPAWWLASMASLSILALGAGWLVATACFAGAAYLLMGPDLRGTVVGYRLQILRRR